MPTRLRLAESFGARWSDITTPFTWFEGGLALATVGVLQQPIRVDGEDRLVAGIHSVGTHPDHRRRGLCDALLRAALVWVDERLDAAKLSTGSPAVFAGHGFVAQPLRRWVTAVTQPRARLRSLDLRDDGDLGVVVAALENRVAQSDVLSTREPGWLTLINAALEQVESSWFWGVRGTDIVLVADVTAERCTIHDVIAPRPVDIAEIAPAGYAEVTFTLEAERIAPQARPVPLEPRGAFMVRGDWPPLDRLAVPPLWEH